jgi:hypothetical protein
MALPVKDGLAVCAALPDSVPGICVVLVSVDDDPRGSSKAAPVRAAPFIRKQDLRPALLAGTWSDRRGAA